MVLLSSEQKKQEIKARAASLGFCFCGFTRSGEMSDYGIYESWLAQNHHGCMDYLATDRHQEFRKQPRALSAWVKTIVVLGWPYQLNRSSGEEQNGQIAGFVGSEDYHIQIPRTLEPLIDDLPRICGVPVRSQVFCDSSPILERELGVRAGLGWIGKNSCLINPDVGSSFLLAEIFLDIDLPADSPFDTDRCGNCHRCVDACPTGCILSNRTIDAGRCISALTIEEKGLIEPGLSDAISNRIFGCDVCQSVCPWNNKNRHADALPPQNLSHTEMKSMLLMTENDFKERYTGTSFHRGKRRGLLRNVCTVIGNLGVSNCVADLLTLFENDPDPIIRCSAAKALNEIDPLKTRNLLQKKILAENDQSVKDYISELIIK